MIIGDRLRTIREAKKLSQGDVEKRSGLLRCYISRVENGHTMPAIETLEKIARALDMPLYQVLYESEAPPGPDPGPMTQHMKAEWGNFGKSARYLHRLTKLLSRMSERNRNLLLELLQAMSKRKAG
jgi:transcriptional regulator with XRE-family HTH domain